VSRDANNTPFMQKDAVMEIDILEKMRTFISQGGQPQVHSSVLICRAHLNKIVVKQLSESYSGMAQMVNLMCHW
jgi:hypothetical protein